MFKYNIIQTKKFKKDIKLAKKQGKDINKIFKVIKRLSLGEKLEPRFHDHSLVGNYNNCRECHIEPDWLLVYEIYENELLILLLRTGSHSDLL